MKVRCINSICVLCSFLFLIVSCKGENKTLKVENLQQNTIKDPEVVEKSSEKFKYPEVKLFLQFYSGMSEKKFIEVANNLSEKKVLHKKNNSGLFDSPYVYYYNVSGIMNWVDHGTDNGVYIRPEFDKNQKLLSISLLNIDLFNKIYSKKYKTPEWPKKSRIYVSKIGKYNRSYKPLDFIESISDSEKRKVLYNKNYIPKKQRLPVPKKFKDKSKTLDMFEKQVYYNNNIDKKSIDTYKDVIELGESTVLIYNKYWRLEKSQDYSLPRPDIPFEDYFNFLDIREIQSKQLIETTFWERNIDVTYTTLEYYNDSQTKSKKLKEQSDRSILDEI